MVTAVINAVNERELVFMGCSYTITVSEPNYGRVFTRRFGIGNKMALVYMFLTIAARTKVHT